MGLTTWKGSPKDKIMRSDTHITKNYLNQREMDRLNRLATMFIRLLAKLNIQAEIVKRTQKKNPIEKSMFTISISFG